SCERGARSAHSSTRAAGEDTSQTTVGIGRHCQKASASAAEATRTYVERSTCAGTSVVQRRLKAGRAIRLCWTAKIPRRRGSIVTATAVPARGPPWSIVRGTTVSARNGTAYAKTARKEA